MNNFDEKQRGEEAKFAIDQQTEFKVMARRSKLLGLWAAKLFGLDGDAAENYAKSVVLSDLEEVGDDDVFRKLRADFDMQDVAISDDDIRAKMLAMLPIAQEQIQAGE